jgi:hypothetical protein
VFAVHPLSVVQPGSAATELPLPCGWPQLRELRACQPDNPTASIRPKRPHRAAGHIGSDLAPPVGQIDEKGASGRLHSDKTTRDRYPIRRYASTAAKHRIAAFTAIRDAFTGNPWIPPIPAIA